MLGTSSFQKINIRDRYKKVEIFFWCISLELALKEFNFLLNFSKMVISFHNAPVKQQGLSKNSENFQDYEFINMSFFPGEWGKNPKRTGGNSSIGNS